MAATKEVALDVPAAAVLIQKRYVQLQETAANLVQLASQTKRAIPCHVISAYNQAVNDYLDFANQVFDQLRAQRLTIEQVIYRDGKPVEDPSDPDKWLVKTIVTPLRPAIFVASQSCPGATAVAPAAFGNPAAAVAAGAAVTAAIAAARLIGTWLFRLGAGYLAVEGLKQVNVTVKTITGREDPIAAVGVYTTCVQKAIAAGVAPAKAAEGCQGAGSGGVAWWKVVGVVTALGGGGAVLYYLWRRNTAKQLADAETAADTTKQLAAPKGKKRRKKAKKVKAAAAADAAVFINPGSELSAADLQG